MSEPDDNCDASLAGDGRFEEALKRVSYEPGMLLGLEATRAEQDYHRRRATRHGYWLHGAGTVAGLRVSLRAEDPGNDTDEVRVRLVVSPGVGVDGLGREISVPEPYCVDLGAWLTAQHEDEALWGALIRDGYAEPDNLLWLKVTMRYQDCNSGLQPVLASEVNAGTDPVQPSRVADCVLFELVAERPDDVPAEEHLFAAHARIRPYAEIEARLGERERAQVVAAAGAARTQLELGARLLHSLGDDNQSLVARQAFLTDPAQLARTLLARIAIRLTPPAPEPGLVVNPRRIEVDNLARPFLFNAAALARMIRA
ncbi:hypothetical protein [Cupriavidus consociatus]|uniref:hypothetical protein n=1 Tax=Cupriavidus consociatus TaxID=2821357 RepID=UPI001AE73325|nr:MULTISPECIES: hypothetical protein [unclassified Cupriavidus]MBP0622464.1 hypothetical protein [Cupriavidus sp. LEh25]MDK2659150.1 hypothetical protein [Cupriavidus sp. LEh21]